MKYEAIQSLRRKLANDQTTYGLWITLESPSITELAVELDRKSTRLNSSHIPLSRMPSSA